MLCQPLHKVTLIWKTSRYLDYVLPLFKICFYGIGLLLIDNVRKVVSSCMLNVVSDEDIKSWLLN